MAERATPEVHAPTSQLLTGAQRDLIVHAARLTGDPSVWEHSLRVARIADALANSPELQGRAVDRQATELAALYHDAGWVLQVRSNDCQTRDLLLKPTTDLQR